jgi:hypothetical protein
MLKTKPKICKVQIKESHITQKNILEGETISSDFLNGACRYKALPSCGVLIVCSPSQIQLWDMKACKMLDSKPYQVMSKFAVKVYIEDWNPRNSNDPTLDLREGYVYPQISKY